MEILTAYWSGAALITNGILMLHLLGATAVGLLLGYERTYHGRAAGMRTYTLVCVASTMLTVINGYPAQWYGGMSITPAAADPTRVDPGHHDGHRIPRRRGHHQGRIHHPRPVDRGVDLDDRGDRSHYRRRLLRRGAQRDSAHHGGDDQPRGAGKGAAASNDAAPVAGLSAQPGADIG